MATKSKGKQKPRPGTQDEFWGHLAVELPRADVDSVNSAAKRAKFMRLYVGASVALLPIALVGILAAVPKLIETPPEPVAIVNELNSPTKSIAIRSVEDWLASDPSPLPGGRILSWDGAATQLAPSLTTDPDTGKTVEVIGLQVHTVTLATPSGALYTATIQVGYSDLRGAQAVGPPSLMPQAPNDTTSWSEMNSWPTLVVATPPDSVEQAVKAWAAAFTSGDPDALRLAVGDEAGNHAYVPLIQATASDTKVEGAATKPLEGGKTAPQNPSTIVAKVSFAVVWANHPIDPLKNTAARLSFDVLIERADTASPVVVAWGGLGSGETLTPYSNAVVDREILKDTIQGPSEIKQ